MPSRREGPPNMWDTWNGPKESSSAPYPQESNPWISNVSEHTSLHVMSEDQTPIQDQRWQSGPSAKKNTSSVEETLQRIMEQTNNDCRFRIFILTSSLRQQPLFAGRWGSKPRYVLEHIFLRKPKKWRCLVQWMVSNFRVLSEEFECRILKNSVRWLLQRWTKSSIIPSSKGESVWRNKKPRKRTASFEVDRLPTWSTITSGSLEPMMLSKTTQRCSLLFFEMTIFRNSILSGTEFYCLWRKSHMMTSWNGCTN